MVGMVRFKAPLLRALDLVGALVLPSLFALLFSLLVYAALLRFDLAPDQAASIAAPTWPGFVVAFFTVALWRSTQAQAEATRAMQELQARMAAADLEPLLGVRIVKEFDEEAETERTWLEVSNLGKYGVLLLGAYWLESCAEDPPEPKAPEWLGKKSDFPMAIPSGATVKAFVLDSLKRLFQEEGADELGCLALSLLHGGESLQRCYDVAKVVEGVLRIVFDFDVSPHDFVGFEVEEGAQPKPDVHEFVNYGTVLTERPCPRWVARALDPAEDG